MEKKSHRSRDRGFLLDGKAVVRLFVPYRNHDRIITTDNGSEFAAHRYITEKLTPKDRDDIIVYFADSYCSWQKGSIENANKLIRRYIPKRADFNRITDKYIKETQKKLNRIPREKLNFNTPKCEFYKNIE